VKDTVTEFGDGNTGLLVLAL
jgi:hypothetical protein